MLKFVIPSKNAKKFIAYVFCLLLFIWNVIYQLNEERYQVLYNQKKVESNISEFTVCINMEKEYNCSNSEGEKRKVCNQLNEFFDFIKDDQIYKTPKSIFERARNESLEKLFIIQPRHDKVDYFLMNKHFCIMYRLEEDNYILFHLYNDYSIPVSIFLEEKEYATDRSLFNYECEEFVRCNGFILNRYQIIVTYLESPFVSDCVNYEKINFDFKSYELIDSRGQCFNECLKQKYRLNFLFYSEKDDDEFQFNLTNHLLQQMWQEDFVLPNECNEICTRRNCVYFKYFDLGMLLLRTSCLSSKDQKNQFKN